METRESRGARETSGSGHSLAELWKLGKPWTGWKRGGRGKPGTRGAVGKRAVRVKLETLFELGKHGGGSGDSGYTVAPGNYGARKLWKLGKRRKLGEL